MNNFATNNDEIIRGLEKSSSAMAAANNTLEENVALFAAGQEIVQNAESVGTALRTMSMRIRGYDEETEQLVEDYEALSGTIADLTKTAKTPGGISLFTDESKQTYRSTYEILKDISEIWEEITDKDQAKLLEKLFAKTRANTGAAILQNFDQAEKAMRKMSEAEGSADREMSVVQDSITFKLNALKETWVGIIQDLAERDDIKEMIDSLTNASEGLGNALNTIAPIITTVVNAISDLISAFGDLNKALPSWLALGLDGGLIGGLLQGIPAISHAFQLKGDVKSQVDKLKKLVATPGETDKQRLTASLDILKKSYTESGILEGIIANATSGIETELNDSGEKLSDVIRRELGLEGTEHDQEWEDSWGQMFD